MRNATGLGKPAPKNSPCISSVVSEDRFCVGSADPTAIRRFGGGKGNSEWKEMSEKKKLPQQSS
jgi:hypothetical protein